MGENGFSNYPPGPIKIDDLMSNLFFRCNNPVFYRKNKYSKVLNGDVCGTSTEPSCATSQGTNYGTLWGRSRDVRRSCFINSTRKHINLTKS